MSQDNRYSQFLKKRSESSLNKKKADIGDINPINFKLDLLGSTNLEPYVNNVDKWCNADFLCTIIVYATPNDYIGCLAISLASLIFNPPAQLIEVTDAGIILLENALSDFILNIHDKNAWDYLPVTVYNTTVSLFNQEVNNAVADAQGLLNKTNIALLFDHIVFNILDLDGIASDAPDDVIINANSALVASVATLVSVYGDCVAAIGPE